LNEDEKDAVRRAGVWTQLAVDLYDHGRYADGAVAAGEGLALNAGAVRAYRAKALCLSQLGRADEALTFADKAVQLEPDVGITHATRALCLHRVGRTEEAEAEFEAATVLSPDDYRVYYNAACYWAERGREDECRRYFALAMELAPESFAPLPAADPDLARFSSREWFRECLAALRRRTGAFKPASAAE
jgi:tetratricopeptide (TPR) repeat protein